MRAIEADCRAVVVNSVYGDNGTVVRVLRPAPPSESVKWSPTEGKVWELDTELPTNKGTCPYSAEHFLRRIDEDWGKTTDFDESIWTPHKQGVEV